MSHVVTIKTRFYSQPAALTAAVKLKAEVLGDGEHRMWGGATARGFGVKLAGMRFPLVFDFQSGACAGDSDALNYNPKAVEEFQQRYAAEAVHLEAARLGQQVTETVLADGSLQLEVIDWS